tara:strand:+ start:47506 stop:48327 length:822 start_codon:yes stop_codon:yes gene_type:complete
MRITKEARQVLGSIGVDVDASNLQHQLQFTKSGRLRKLLGSNLKVEKGNKEGVLTAIMHLAPAYESGFNTCPFATNCASVCINKTGQLVTNMAHIARVSKTALWKLFPDEFLAQLRMELNQHIYLAGVKGMKPAVRLNGTSDVAWERTGIVDEFPDLTYYDYTKWPLEHRKPGPNYHLTYSLSEEELSLVRAVQYLAAGHNAAAVFQSEDGTTRATAEAAVQRLLKAGRWMGYPITSGDTDDIRFDDPPGHWIALFAKGPATKDTTGFVRRVA